MTEKKSELELLRDTLTEVRHAQPKCGHGDACGRVATFRRYDEDTCDAHRRDGMRELPIARVARRLGW
jgi:hypothetical protein